MANDAVPEDVRKLVADAFRGVTNISAVAEYIAVKCIMADRAARPSREDVLEEAAQMCDAEARKRWDNSNKAEGGDTSWGLDTADVSRIQGHKAVTATGLAATIRSLKSQSPSPAVEGVRDDVLFDAVTRAQDILAAYIVPDSGISDFDCVNRLLGVLDAQDLVRHVRSLKTVAELADDDQFAARLADGSASVSASPAAPETVKEAGAADAIDALRSEGRKMSREDEMVVVSRKADGTPDVWCDPEIADLVAALNRGGIRTVASCSGHGHRPGNIALQDGRELFILPSYEAAREAEKVFPHDINGASPSRPVEAVPVAWEDRAVKLAQAALIKAGDALSFAAQTSGGTAGRDDGLMAAIEGWTKARDAYVLLPIGDFLRARTALRNQNKDGDK